MALTSRRTSRPPRNVRRNILPSTAASRAASRNWKARNRERVREDRARYYAENRDRACEVNAAWRSEHRPRGDAEARRAWRESKRAWRTSDSAAARAEQARRGMSLDAESEAYLSILKGDPCAHCGDPATSIDHIVPVSVGGEDRWENFAAVCVPCNSSKNAVPLLLWLART